MLPVSEHQPREVAAGLLPLGSNSKKVVVECNEDALQCVRGFKERRIFFTIAMVFESGKDVDAPLSQTARQCGGDIVIHVTGKH
jgi:hypothetical protein